MCASRMTGHANCAIIGPIPLEAPRMKNRVRLMGAVICLLLLALVALPLAE